MVGFPAMRRGSLTRVTRPWTVVPIGTTVLPSSRTGCVTRPENGSPALLVNVDSPFSSFTFRAVPAGKDRLDCPQAAAVTRIIASNTSNFFIAPPGCVNENFLSDSFIQDWTVKHRKNMDNNRTGT